VLVPGLDGTALLFYRQAPILARRFHVETFPLPDDESCTMESLVAMLKERVERLASERGEEKVFLCGESFGGALSLSFALRHPEKLAGLVVLNSFPYIRQRVRIRLGPPLLKLMPWGAMPLVRRFTESRLHSSHTLPEDIEEFHRVTAIGRRGYIRRLELCGNTTFGTSSTDRRSHPVSRGRRDHLVLGRGSALHGGSECRGQVKVLEGYGHICMIHYDFDLLEHGSRGLAEGERQ
jgi:pimeloyl-ACP methyl ester carboxylesterase